MSISKIVVTKLRLYVADNFLIGACISIIDKDYANTLLAISILCIVQRLLQYTSYMSLKRSHSKALKCLVSGQHQEHIRHIRTYIFTKHNWNWNKCLTYNLTIDCILWHYQPFASLVDMLLWTNRCCAVTQKIVLPLHQ